MPEFPETLTVDITQNDIDEGVRLDCENCPTALASMRAIKPIVKVEKVQVDADSVIFESRFQANYMKESVLIETCYNVSHDLAIWIGAFDLEENVKPQTFDLSLEEAG